MKAKSKKLFITIFVKKGISSADVVLRAVTGGSCAYLTACFVDDAAVAEGSDTALDHLEDVNAEPRTLEVEQRYREIVVSPCADGAQLLALRPGSRQPPFLRRSTVGAAAAEKAPMP